MHSCRDNFLLALARSGSALTKRDLPSNINFFMNVPVTPAGKLTFADGVSAAGRYVEMRAEMDVIVLISNCPQLNNPCNAYILFLFVFLFCVSVFSFVCGFC